jgi:enoyl-[acyl-carrier protein] reductase II
MMDIEFPVFLAGMGGIAFAELCAAVSEAGGYGTLGMAAHSSEDAASAGAHSRARSRRYDRFA